MSLIVLFGISDISSKTGVVNTKKSIDDTPAQLLKKTEVPLSGVISEKSKNRAILVKNIKRKTPRKMLNNFFGGTFVYKSKDITVKTVIKLIIGLNQKVRKSNDKEKSIFGKG